MKEYTVELETIAETNEEYETRRTTRWFYDTLQECIERVNMEMSYSYEDSGTITIFKKNKLVLTTDKVDGVWE